MSSSRAPESFPNVEVATRANVYFGGKVVSHSLTLPGGAKKTLGVIYPGRYRFDTSAPERMQIVAGICRVRIGESPDWQRYEAGSEFRVAGHSAFEIEVDAGVDGGLAQYVCSFE
jgi:purine/pyrimidine-nucleoside phosphorylase